jgi:hypothetical protein
VFEYFGLSLLYTLGKDALSAIRKRHRHVSAAEIVQLRQRWKPIFEDKLAERRRDKLRTDVIVHDVKRLDQYPHGEHEVRGISAWFRVGLMGTYHGGIFVGLRWEKLKLLPDDNWGIADTVAGEEGDQQVILIGKIPYERIEAVDWDGDEYYTFPHIYCHFDGPGGQPYQCLVYSERKYLDEFPFYVDIASEEAVRRATKKHRKGRREELRDSHCFRRLPWLGVVLGRARAMPQRTREINSRGQNSSTSGRRARARRPEN